MLPLFSFILMWFGSLNWFFISAFQYDFVAGFFGTQSSLFSRIIYFAIGMAGFYLLIHFIKNKGKLNLWIKQNKSKTPKATPTANVVEINNQKNTEFDESSPHSSQNHDLLQTNYESKAETGYKDFDISIYDN